MPTAKAKFNLHCPKSDLMLSFILFCSVLTVKSEIITEHWHSWCRQTLWQMGTPYGPRHAKTYIRAWTTKAQISLRIHTVWSELSLSTYRIIGHYRMYQWRAYARMALFACMGWICATFLLGAAHIWCYFYNHRFKHLFSSLQVSYHFLN